MLRTVRSDRRSPAKCISERTYVLLVMVGFILFLSRMLLQHGHESPEAMSNPITLNAALPSSKDRRQLEVLTQSDDGSISSKSTAAERPLQVPQPQGTGAQVEAEPSAATGSGTDKAAGTAGGIKGEAEPQGNAAWLGSQLHLPDMPDKAETGEIIGEQLPLKSENKEEVGLSDEDDINLNNVLGGIGSMGMTGEDLDKMLELEHPRSEADELLATACGAAQLPQLTLEWSAGSSDDDRRLATDVTLVTQLSLERLPMLQAQCGAWTGPLAAVVYVPVLDGRIVSLDDAAINGTSVDDQINMLISFQGEVGGKGPCRLDMELVSEKVPGVVDAGHYPFNALRNRALMLARTQGLLVLDVDFLPQANFSSELADAQKYMAMLENLEHRAVVVLPAFAPAAEGPEGSNLVRRLSQAGKSEMLDAMAKEQVVVFQLDKWKKGHRATRYSRWAAANTPYMAQYEEGYEPYFLVYKKWLQFYDERFRGYGKDKIVHALHMNRSVSFMVHPAGYLLHQPHPRSRGYEVTKQTGQWNTLMDLYKQVRDQIQRDVYQPVSYYTCR